jgi:rhodanese-related sulfurtransferase
MTKKRPAKKPAANTMNSRVVLSIAALLVMGALTIFVLSGGLNNAPAAPAVAAASSGASDEGLMISRPQALAPQDYMTRFVDAQEEYLLVDVRTPEEFASGHIAGAINIPVEELGSRLAEIGSDKPVVLYCRSGNRSTTAASILESAGYEGVYNLGGTIQWTAAGLPLE